MSPSGMRTACVTTAVALGGALAFLACGGGSQPAVTTAAPGGSRDARRWPADDQSLCQTFAHWKNNPRLEVSETVGPGAIKPNVRRVFKVMGERDDRHAVLVCREIDTNLDGIKDVVRTFNEKGEPLHEEADSNYDGRIDDWINFADGRIEEEDMDTTFSAGRPNVWKFYINGELSRVRRNTHCASGKADTWEIYFKNRLERVGNDVSCDGHVDRWDRDTQLMAQEEAQQQVEIVEAGAPEGGASGTAPVTVGATGEFLDGGAGLDAARAKRPKK